MSGFKVKVTGAKEVRKGLKSLEKAHPRAFAAALYKEGFALAEMADVLIPVDTGRLRATLYVKPPVEAGVAGFRPSVEVGVGTDYAVIVHEQIESKHAGETQAKYIEHPYNLRKSGFFSRIQRWTLTFAKRKIGVGGVTGPFGKTPKG